MWICLQRLPIVIDTSTLVGAVLCPDSVPRQAFMAAVRTCELCVSRATLDELREVLRQRLNFRQSVSKAAIHFVQAVGLAAAGAVFDQALLGQIEVL